jgi:hypothetical protein
MNEGNQGSRGNEGSDAKSSHPDYYQEPYWKRAHRDWRIWVALFFMFAAITIYVLSNNLSFFPFGQPRAALSGAAGK